MKRTLALLLAVAFTVPAFAGNIFSNVETYGEIETIGFNVSADIVNAKSVVSRTLFGVSADLVEDVRANLTFTYGSMVALNGGLDYYINAWGSFSMSDPNPIETVSGSSIDTYLQRIMVSEANVVISNIFGALEAKIGRQFYGNEDSPVMYLGPRRGTVVNVGGPLVISLDGALLSWNGESTAVSAFYAQAAAFGIVPLEKVRLTGLTLDHAFTNNLTAGLYWYDVAMDDGLLDAKHIGIWGGKVAYQSEGLKLGVEYAKNYLGHTFGHNNEGWMLKADVALNLDTENVSLTPRLGYYRTEKNFISLGNYTAGLILGNLTGISGAAALFVPELEVEIFNAGVDFGFKSLEKVTFTFDYLNAKAIDTWLCNEFDLVAKYHHNDYVTFTLGGAMTTNTVDFVGDIYAAQVGMLIKF